MEAKSTTQLHQKVIKILKEEHLTSFQILSKLKNINLILEVYNVIDDLTKSGILKSYIKEDMKFYYVS